MNLSLSYWVTPKKVKCLIDSKTKLPEERSDLLTKLLLEAVRYLLAVEPGGHPRSCA